VSQGAAVSKVDAAQLFKDVLAGMDEAVMKVVEANQVVLNKLAGAGGAFEQSRLKHALDEVQHMEEQFIRAVGQAAQASEAKLKTAWGPVLQQMQAGGSQTGAQAREVARPSPAISKSNCRHRVRPRLKPRMP
jgi:hypothetical protein